MFFDQGFKIIDGTIQKINLYYFLFLKNENKYPEPEKNIRIAKSEKLLVEYFQTLKSITVDWVDCPSAIKIPEGWIVYYDQYTREKIGAVLLRDLNSWKDFCDQISL